MSEAARVSRGGLTVGKRDDEPKLTRAEREDLRRGYEVYAGRVGRIVQRFEYERFLVAARAHEIAFGKPDDRAVLEVHFAEHMRVPGFVLCDEVAHKEIMVAPDDFLSNVMNNPVMPVDDFLAFVEENPAPETKEEQAAHWETELGVVRRELPACEFRGTFKTRVLLPRGSVHMHVDVEATALVYGSSFMAWQGRTVDDGKHVCHAERGRYIGLTRRGCVRKTEVVPAETDLVAWLQASGFFR